MLQKIHTKGESHGGLVLLLGDERHKEPILRKERKRDRETILGSER
jgi:hypothetical protein